MSSNNHNKSREPDEEEKQITMDSKFENVQTNEIKNKPIEEFEDESKKEMKEKENLMENLNPYKLKQLLEAHVGGGPFSEAILERKKYSFELLKLWDSEKCELLQNHKNILETFVKKIEKKQEFLRNAMTSVVKFFTQKVNQETDYITYFQKKIPKLTNIYQETVVIKKMNEFDHLKGNGKEINDFFPQFSGFFEEIDQLVLAKQKKLEAYKLSIEKDILQEILLKENNEYDKATLEIRDEIIGIRKKIAKANSSTAENSTKHAKLFTEMLDPSMKIKSDNTDLYNSEISLVSSSEEQIRLHRMLAKEIMKFWQKLSKIEATRLKVIQKAFQEFLVISEEYFGTSVEYTNIRTLLINIEFTEDLEKYLEIEKCFSAEDTNSLKKYIPEFNFKYFQSFLEEMHINQIESSPLVVKEFEVEREFGNMISGKYFKKCRIILTVDNNLLIIDDVKPNEKKAADYILKIENVSIKRRSEPGYIELQVKTKGLIFHGTDYYVLKVDDTDIYDEIIIYIDFVKLRKWF